MFIGQDIKMNFGNLCHYRPSIRILAPPLMRYKPNKTIEIRVKVQIS